MPLQTKDRIAYRKAKCRSKRAFDTLEEATAEPGKYAYVCRVCGKFHRTSYPQSAKVQLETLRKAGKA
jgi:hypothetical protein